MLVGKRCKPFQCFFKRNGREGSNAREGSYAHFSEAAIWEKGVATDQLEKSTLETSYHA